MKFSIAATLMATLAPAAAQEVISLHGSGTTNPSKVRRCVAQLELHGDSSSPSRCRCLTLPPFVVVLFVVVLLAHHGSHADPD